MRSLLGHFLALALGAVAFSPTVAQAQANFYVSPTGSDSNPGTAGAPFRTVDRARQAVAPLAASMTGDIVVYLRGGTHFLSAPLRFGPADSGTNGFNVIYRNYPGETPVLSGGTRVTGWAARAAGDPVYMAPWTPTVTSRSLYVNGVRAQRTSVDGPGKAVCPPTCPPTAPPPTIKQVKWTPNGQGYTTDNVPPLHLYKNQNQIEFVFTAQPAWAEQRCQVDIALPFAVLMQGRGNANGCWKFAYAQRPSDQKTTLPTTIENIYEALDAPGEFYLDTSGATRSPAAQTLYYVPRAGESMATAEAIVPVLETLIEVVGTADSKVHDLTFRGLSFQHTTYRRPNTAAGYPEKQATIVTDGGVVKMPAAVLLHATENVVIRRNTFTRLGGAGLNLQAGTSGALVEGNVFTDISGTAIQVGDVNDPNPTHPGSINDGDEITNNWIHHVGVEFRGAVGIFVAYATNLLVAYNQLNDLPYTGVSVGWGWGYQDPNVAENIRINNNLIYEGMQQLHDGACVYTLGELRDMTVRGNVCRDFNQTLGGLYADQGSRYITYVNNVVYGNKSRPHPWYLPFKNAFFHKWIDNVVLKYSFMDIARCCGAGTNNGDLADDYELHYIPETVGRPTLGPVALQAPYVPASRTDLTMFPASIIKQAGIRPAFADILPPVATPADVSPPTTPSGLSLVSVGSNHAVLTWNPSTDDFGVTAYQIDQTSPESVVLAASQTTSVTIGARPAEAPSALVTSAGDLLPGTTYKVAVRARDAAGNLSAMSPVLTFTTAP